MQVRSSFLQCATQKWAGQRLLQVVFQLRNQSNQETLCNKMWQDWKSRILVHWQRLSYLTRPRAKTNTLSSTRERLVLNMSQKRLLRMTSSYSTKMAQHTTLPQMTLQRSLRLQQVLSDQLSAARLKILSGIRCGHKSLGSLWMRASRWKSKRRKHHWDPARGMDNLQSYPRASVLRLLLPPRRAKVALEPNQCCRFWADKVTLKDNMGHLRAQGATFQRPSTTNRACLGLPES